MINWAKIYPAPWMESTPLWTQNRRHPLPDVISTRALECQKGGALKLILFFENLRPWPRKIYIGDDVSQCHRQLCLRNTRPSTTGPLFCGVKGSLRVTWAAGRSHGHLIPIVPQWRNDCSCRDRFAQKNVRPRDYGSQRVAWTSL